SATTSRPPETNDDGIDHGTRRTQAGVAVARPPAAAAEADQPRTAYRNPDAQGEGGAALAAGARRRADRRRPGGDDLLRQLLDFTHARTGAAAVRHHPPRLRRCHDHRRGDGNPAAGAHRLCRADRHDPEVPGAAAAVAHPHETMVWSGAVDPV